MPVNLNSFRPGRGHRVLEYLASGAWKSAFRGTAPGILEDVALLCYREASGEDAARDVSQLIRLDNNHLYAIYLATFHTIFRGDDGRIWIVEELLRKSLASLSRLYDAGKFARVSRDLSRALKCIHDQNLVHRDIKLDNCGLDRFDRAKIFDLGSLVSEPGDIGCTILTRAPELLRGGPKSEEKYSRASDVWALGATLYALFTGNYPFVSRAEVRERALVNERVVNGEIDEKEGKRLKSTIDEKIYNRCSSRSAESDLFEKIHSEFGGDLSDILCKMLDFDENARIDTDTLVHRWGTIAGNFAGEAPLVHNVSDWDRIKKILLAIERGELSVTQRQLGRVIDEWNKSKEQNPSDAPLEEMETLIQSVRIAIESRVIAA